MLMLLVRLAQLITSNYIQLCIISKLLHLVLTPKLDLTTKFYQYS